MEKKPLFIFGAAAFAGAFSAGLKPWYLTYAVLIGTPVLCVIYAFYAIINNRRYARQLIFILTVTSVLPLLAYNGCVYVWKSRLAEFSDYDGKGVAAKVKITGPVVKSGDYYRTEARVLCLTGEDGADGAYGEPDSSILYTGKILISYSPADDGVPPEIPVFGAVANIRGRLVKPARQQNDYLFDYQKYLFSRGLSATIYIANGNSAAGDGIAAFPKEIFGIPVNPVGAGIAVNNRIGEIFRNNMPAKEAALATAIITGKTDELDERSRENFVGAGLLHMTSVSGMHVIIIAGILTALLKKMGFGINAVRIITLFLVIAFTFITGFSASVVRAALAFIISSASKLAGKPFDPLSATGLSALAVLLNNPMQAFGAGFILSFSSVLSICILSKVIRKRVEPLLCGKPRRRGAKSVNPSGIVLDSICGSVAVCAGCYPIQAALFHQFPAVTVLSNLLCAPLIPAALALGIITAVTGFISAALASAPALIMVNFIWAIERVAEFTSKIPGASVRTGEFNVAELIIYYAILTITYLVLTRGSTQPGPAKVKAFYAISALAAAALFFLFARGVIFPTVGKEEMEIVFLDTGNSSAAYIDVGGRYRMIIDSGGAAGFSGNGTAADWEGGNPETRLYEYITGRGASSIDLAVATHGDTDHIQGFWTIVRHMPVRRLMISYNADEQLEELAAFAEKRGTDIIRCGTGDTVSLGAYAEVEVIWPFGADNGIGRTSAPMSVNDNSLVTRIVFGNMKALFCGDIGVAAEDEIVYRAGYEAINSQIMSVPHHGSKFSSGSGFIAAVSPEAAVAEVGKNNYGHPAADVITRYSENGAVFLRTDTDGMIKIRCARDGAYKINSFNGYENLPAWRRSNP